MILDLRPRSSDKSKITDHDEITGQIEVNRC